MTNPLLRRGKEMPIDKSARYAKLGLTDNPFPAEPTVSPDHPDPRRNGSIYCETLHEDKMQSFESLLIARSEGPTVRPLVFLMDHTTARGRGIGKTAFLNRRQNEILRDFGSAASRGDEVVFAVHIIPPVNPECRKFWELTRLICDRLIDRNVILQAVCRLRATYPKMPETVFEEVGEIDEWPETIGSDDWLRERRVDRHELNRHVRQQLYKAGVRDMVADKIAANGNNRAVLRSWLFSSMKITTWRKEGPQIVFDDFVKVFRAAGFTRGLLLIDEMEKIVRPQNSTERRNFVESLRYFLIDGDCEAARTGFYGTVLTIHPGIQELLLQHWQVTGLDRSAPLHEPDVKQNEISFGPLSREHADLLVQEYLGHYGKDTASTGVSPFTKEAIDAALVKSRHVPGPMLNLLFNAIERAAERGVESIDGPFIEQLYDERNQHGEALVQPDQLPAPQTLLMDEED